MGTVPISKHVNKRSLLSGLVAAVIVFFFLSACNASQPAGMPTETFTPQPATPKPATESTIMETPVPQPTFSVPGGIVYSIPEMEPVVATYTNVPYSPENEALKLDVYTPPGLSAGARLPAVLFVHGSAAARRNIKNHAQYVSWGKLVGASDLIAVTFNWDYPDPSGIEQAIAFVREHADEFQIDGDRLCVFAVSAGVSAGFTVALNDTPSYLRCVVGYYGNPSPALELIPPQEASQLPPILLAKAAQDNPTLIAGTDRFVSELTALGAPVTLLEHPNGVHAFDIRNDDDRSRQIIKQTMEFIKLNLAE